MWLWDFKKPLLVVYFIHSGVYNNYYNNNNTLLICPSHYPCFSLLQLKLKSFWSYEARRDSQGYLAALFPFSFHTHCVWRGGRWSVRSQTPASLCPLCAESAPWHLDLTRLPLLSLSLPFNFADIMYNGEMNEKIKLLYRLHIPPGKKVLSRKLELCLLCLGLDQLGARPWGCSLFKRIQTWGSRHFYFGVADDRFDVPYCVVCGRGSQTRGCIRIIWAACCNTGCLAYPFWLTRSEDHTLRTTSLWDVGENKPWLPQ